MEIDKVLDYILGIIIVITLLNLLYLLINGIQNAFTIKFLINAILFIISDIALMNDFSGKLFR